MKKCKVLAMFIALAFASYVNGGTILDQSQTNQYAEASINSTRSLCQTFTVGTSGRLTKIDLCVKVFTNSATISIVGTTNSIPSGEILWSTNYLSYASEWVSIEIIPRPFLTAGNVYGIKIERNNSSIDKWWVEFRNDYYSGGKLWENKGGGWQMFTTGSLMYPAADACFKTYIKTDDGTVLKLL